MSGPPPADRIDVAYSHHLVQLVARAEAASTRLAAADPDARSALAAEARRESALLTCRLDGSPLLPETAARVDAGDVPHLAAPAAGDPALVEHGVGWARALKLEGMETQEVAAVEYANALALAEVEGALAERVLADLPAVLTALHGTLCHGLVDPAVIGRPRETEQAVHDGGQGMVIYDAPAPEGIAPALDALATWLDRRTVVLPPVITAGVLHERVLEIQPFEAGNGRVARAAARLVLVGAGIDPHGAAVVERQLWADAVGYYAEVAATVRRQGDLTRWLERHTGALARALEAAADVLDPRPRPALPDRGRARVARVLPGRTINLREYAQDVGVDVRTALQDLAAFARAGELVEAPGGGGLSFQRPAPDPQI